MADPTPDRPEAVRFANEYMQIVNERDSLKATADSQGRSLEMLQRENDDLRSRENALELRLEAATKALGAALEKLEAIKALIGQAAPRRTPADLDRLSAQLKQISPPDDGQEIPESLRTRSR